MLNKIKNYYSNILEKIKKTQAEKRKFLQLKKKEKREEIKIPEKIIEHRSIVDISTGSIVKMTVIVLVIFYLSQLFGLIGNIFLLLLCSFILSAGVEGIVDYLETKKVPRLLGVIIVYILFLVVVIFIFSSFIPVLGEQLISLGDFLKHQLENINANGVNDLSWYQKTLALFNLGEDFNLLGNITKYIGQISDYFLNITGNTLNVVSGVFDSFVSVGTVLVLTFYMALDKDCLNNFVISISPKNLEQKTIDKGEQIKNKMGDWLRGQICLCFIVGIGCYIVLLVMGVKYAATLALLAGIMELIPYVGVLISMLVAGLVAIFQGPIVLLGVVIGYILVQFLEGNVFVPLVMKKAVGLSPIAVIIAMLIGWKTMGLVWIVLSVPIATVVSLLINEYVMSKK